MNKKQDMGRWELGCLVFNSLVYKILTHYTATFAKCSGSASWLTAIFSGALFLALLWLVLRLYAPFSQKGLIEAVRERFGNTSASLIAFLGIVYFLFSLCYALSLVCNALKSVSYTTSPLLYIGFFLVLSSVIILVCGENAICRVHSLSALGVAAAVAIISIMSLKYADPHNLTPILGTGPLKVLGSGLSTLFLYSDILIIFFLPKHKEGVSFSKTVMLSAIIATALNIFVIAAAALNVPYELAQRISLPIYPLTKTANFGKLPLRLDTLYHTALIVSAILYVSLALNIILRCVKALRTKAKAIGVSLLCLLVCFCVTGCYDSSEIEENAYIIALGIDKGESEDFKYTFQISNPLQSGGSMGAEEKAEENSSSSSEGNKTVDNIVVEADDYFLAQDKLKQILSKDAKMSHLKLIVFSEEIASAGALEHSELLLHEREIRPGTNLCLADNASDYLFSVNPTLEESTVRYYELFFRNRDVPSAPVTELRDFVGRSINSSYDAVMPIVGKEGLSGMGLFSDGIMKTTASAEETFFYKLLCDDLKRVAIDYNDTSYMVSTRKKPKVRTSITNDIPTADIEVCIKTVPPADGNFIKSLERRAETFLYKTSRSDCDILGIGRRFKVQFPTQKKWEAFDWSSKYKNCRFNIEIMQ